MGFLLIERILKMADGKPGKSKKNRKSKKNGVEDVDGAIGGSADSAEMVPVQDAEKMTGNMNLIKLKKALDEMSKDVKDSTDKKSYEFWSTQPVPKIDEEITTNEAIEPDLSLDKLRQDPYSLPAGFHWDTLNLDDPIVVSYPC